MNIFTDCSVASLLAPSINLTGVSLNNASCSVTGLGYLGLKFWLVAVFGTFLSAVGIIQNGLLAYLFISREKFRNSNMFFLGWAAFFDMILDITYPLNMAVSVLWEYYFNVPLLHAWHSYVIPLNAVSHVSMTASTFLLSTATYERFRLTMHWRFASFSLVYRCFLLLIAILLALGLKAPIYFEIVVLFIPECERFDPLGIYMLSHSCLSKSDFYGTVYKFWIRKSVCKVVPFLLLFTFNISIIIKLRRGKKSSMLDMRNAMLTIAYGEKSLDRHRKQVHRATRTMVLVTFAYLGTHLLDFFVSTWELLDVETIKKDHFMFYTISADIISILVVLGNVLRLPIYCTSDKEIRGALRCLLRDMWRRLKLPGTQPPEQLRCHCNDANGSLLVHSHMTESLEYIHQLQMAAGPNKILNGHNPNRRLSHLYG